MKLINRSGVSIRPKHSFHEWLVANIEEEIPSLEELRLEGTLYLFDEVNSEEDFEAALEGHWLSIFNNELEAWDEFGDVSPKSLSREMFHQWFDVDLQLMSFDLSKRPLMLADMNMDAGEGASV